MKKLFILDLLLIFLFLTYSNSFAQNNDTLSSQSNLLTISPKSQIINKEEKKPVFTVGLHGTVRGKYEYQFDMGKGRFQVRNARFSLSGNVTSVAGYKMEIDLSDEGKIKMLDAYVRLNMLQKKLRFTIGQMRVPFTIDAHRSPHQQYFANRSFIAKQVGNVRDVGATLGYSFGETVPVSIDAGIFNGSGLTEQKDFWTGNYNYSAKIQALFGNCVNLTLSLQKTHPDITDILMYDAGIYFEKHGFHVEAEYLRKNYTQVDFAGVNAIDAFVCYDLKVKEIFKKISFLARYDYMSDHSNGIANETGILYVNDPERHRLTAGLTFSLGLPFQADIRFNYEKYFYKKYAIPAISEQDKIVLEFVARF